MQQNLPLADKELNMSEKYKRECSGSVVEA